MTALELAKAAGSPAAALDKVQSRPFLLACAKKAKVDPDIIDDILDACEINDFSALSLAGHDFSADKVAEKLFLTVDEATDFLEACQSMCAKEGVRFDAPIAQQSEERGAEETVVDNEELPTLAEEPEPAAADEQHDEDVFEPSEMAAPEPVLDESWTHVDRNAENVMPLEPETPQGHDIQPTISNLSAVTSNPSLPTNHSVLAPAPRTDDASSEDKPLFELAGERAGAWGQKTTGRPTSAPVVQQLVMENSSKSVYGQDDIAEEHFLKVPSFMRPTQSSKSRLSPGEDDKGQKPVPALGRWAASISPSLVRPTESFMAKQGKGGKAADDLTRSSNRAPRDLTKPKPFTLRTSMRPTEPKITTEELQMERARREVEESRRSRIATLEAVRHGPRSRRAASVPARSCTEFVPFNLQSQKRHNQVVDDFNAKVAREHRAEVAARQFKARGVNREMLQHGQELHFEKRPVTTAKAPVFASEERLSYRHTVLHERKVARQVEHEQLRDEEERKRMEEEARAVTVLRKSLKFKARGMPDFKKHDFHVDYSRSRPTTKPAEPQFHTDKRMGKPKAKGHDEDLVRAPSSPLAVADAFSALLRSKRSGFQAKLSPPARSGTRRASIPASRLVACP